MGGTISLPLVAQKSDLSESRRHLFTANDQLQVCAPCTIYKDAISKKLSEINSLSQKSNLVLCQGAWQPYNS